ncbi:hypothetical protein KSZ_62010 [Dictyobacter formicarum]|uniref:Uncharacterized protein n=1 Tax=Dictyobacter formicarum TaxID=2778368 RepID=A0ABQ3VQ08_9CHLR|nr:hypothetical protein KSZ_62010 [Dictyobacter formicarum]
MTADRTSQCAPSAGGVTPGQPSQPGTEEPERASRSPHEQYKKRSLSKVQPKNEWEEH